LTQYKLQLLITFCFTVPFLQIQAKPVYSMIMKLDACIVCTSLCTVESNCTSIPPIKKQEANQYSHYA
jgi:hypothetical protein